MSIKNWLIGILAVAVIVAGVFLVLQVSGAGKTSSATAANTSGKHSGAKHNRSGFGSARSGAGGVQGDGTPAEPELPAPLTVEERSTMEMERLLAGEVRRRIRVAASGCYDGSLFTYKTLENEEKDIEIEFTLVLKDSQFTLEGLKLTSGIGDADLEECVIEMVSEITWQDKVNADFSQPMSDAISLLALKKYGAPMPHELEEEPEDPNNADFGHGPNLPDPNAPK